MKTQFRVLYRQFLFRIVDLELLSASAQGDMTRLFGQFAALLVFVGVAFAWAGPLLLHGNMSPSTRLMLSWSGEHFLIATTMLVVGLFAVLSWDTTFPDRRDVLVLAPLPLATCTFFRAKVAAVATALAVPILALHALPSLTWPFELNWDTPAQSAPALTNDAAMLPLSPADLEPVLKHDLDHALRIGPLAPGAGGGMAIGVVKHGVRRIFTYGTAKPDSIYEIGSITKTFTGLLLAQTVLEGKARLDEPVRELLPPGTVAKPDGPEITLLDLITHHSGLPSSPFNIHPDDPKDPWATYTVSDLYSFLNDWGVKKRGRPPFEYSNAGVALAGEALANRTGIAWADLIREQITQPLGLHDTVAHLSPEQQRRLIQGYAASHEPAAAWHLDGIEGAGAIRSTAGDMLTYLEANLGADRPPVASSLRSALRYSHQLRAQAGPGMSIAMAWFYVPRTGTYWHSGATRGYTADAFFNPKGDYAAVVLLNQGPNAFDFVSAMGEHLRARLAGEPAISLDMTRVPAVGGLLHALRLFAVYWFVMFAAGAFIYCSVLALQGLAAQLLPRPLFLRISSLLQLITFCVLVSVYFLQPLITAPGELPVNQNRALATWSPSYWFLGLFQQLSGSSALAPLAHRAWVALTVAIAATALAYTLSYFRTLRRIVEEPDITPVRRRILSLPRLGGNLPTAIGQFTIRTLLRSRQHRMFLAFFLGVAFALTIFFVRSPGALDLSALPADGQWSQVTASLLAATLIVTAFWIVGARVVLSMPIDLHANWIFRVTPVSAGPKLQIARRRALLAASLFPCLGVLSVPLFSIWPWRAAAEHILILALVGFILCELCLWGRQKIPFTCSYLPGKSHFNIAFLLCMWFVFVPLAKAAEFERAILEEPRQSAILVLALATLAALAYWRTWALARGIECALDFEETGEPAIVGLNLNDALSAGKLILAKPPAPPV